MAASFIESKGCTKGKLTWSAWCLTRSPLLMQRRAVISMPTGQAIAPSQVWVPMPPKSGGKAPSILSADDEDHARTRRAWGYGFSETVLKDREPLVPSHVDMLVERLRQQVDSTTGAAVPDIMKWYNFCAFDIIGDLAFGESFG